MSSSWYWADYYPDRLPHQHGNAITHSLADGYCYPVEHKHERTQLDEHGHEDGHQHGHDDELWLTLWLHHSFSLTLRFHY